MPIRYRFSLVAGSLLLALAAALVTAAYLEVRRSGRSAAENRLSVAAGQLAESFSSSARALLQRADSLAQRGEIAAFLRSGSLESPGRAIEALTYAGPQPEVVLSVELRDRFGGRLLTTGRTTLEEDLGRTVISPVESDTRTSIGDLVIHEDSILYPAIARVEHSGEAIGHVIQWRVLRSTPQALRQFGRLIGDSATLLFGNRRQNVWSDLTGPTVIPPFDASAMGSLMDYVRPGAGRRLGVATPVAGTPWLLILEFPATQVLGPASSFLGRTLAIASVFVLGGLVAMWGATRTLTRPLTDLVTAADAVAEGRFDTRIPERGRGELGRLAGAFSAMSTRVESTMQTLEARVAERTAELERLNAELANRNGELEAVNHELDTFCHSVAHDLRAPLRAIDGFSRMLIEDRGAVLDAEAHRLLTVIRGSTAMMGQLIDDLLTLSRFSRRPLDTTTVDMNAMLPRVIADVRSSRSDSPRIEVADLPAVPADATLIRQVWFNLIDNAVKFSRQASDPVVSIAGDIIGNEARFSVRDNGVGFNPAYSSKLFGIFQRLHRAEDFEGTGVGLAIVQRVVVRHGGRVWAHSEPGSGATFGFSLPLQGVEA